MSNHITITINDWELYINKKAHQKSSSWFMMPIDWPTRLMTLDARESMCFLMLVTYISKYGEKGSITLNLKRDIIKISSPLRTKEKNVIDMIKKLDEHGIILTSSEVHRGFNQGSSGVQPDFNLGSSEVQTNNQHPKNVSFQTLSEINKGGIIGEERREEERREEEIISSEITKNEIQNTENQRTLRVSANADENQNQESNNIIIPESATHLMTNKQFYPRGENLSTNLGEYVSLDNSTVQNTAVEMGRNDAVQNNHSLVPTIDKNGLTLTETHISEKSLSNQRKSTKNDVLNSQAEEVLAFLNEKTGKSFRFVPANLKMIAKCLADSSVEDAKRIIGYKCEEWGHDPKMSKYLQPATLFAVSNYEKYLGQSSDWKSTPSFDEMMLAILATHTQEELNRKVEESHARGLERFGHLKAVH